jgi:predicted lipase
MCWSCLLRCGAACDLSLICVARCFAVVQVPTDIANWIVDLYASKRTPFPPAPQAEVHTGFWTAYSRLRSQLITGVNGALSAIEAAGSVCGGLLTTGHSLGGALATIAAVDLKLTGAPPPAHNLSVAVWTYGSPRVGDSAFSALFDSLVDVCWRHTHWNDVVVHLPPQALGFTHVSIEVYWNEPFNTYTVCNQSMNGEQSSCADGALLPVSVNDHLHYFNVSLPTVS